MIRDNLALIDGLRETLVLGGQNETECASVLRFLCRQHKGQIHTTYPPTSLVLACVERVEGQNLAALISVLLNQTYTHYASTGPVDRRLIAQQMLMTSAALIAHDPAMYKTLQDVAQTQSAHCSLSYSMGFSLNTEQGRVPAHFEVQHSLIAEPLVKEPRRFQVNGHTALAGHTDEQVWDCRSPDNRLQ